MALSNRRCLQFRHREVRELAWCLNSPPLFKRLPETTTEMPLLIVPCLDEPGLESWLEQLDREPAALITHLSQVRSPRLGIYFEGLIAFFWQHFPGCRLLEQNLQINETAENGQKYTIGELDFVVQRQSACWHIEAAVKFYLGIEPETPAASPLAGSAWSQWVGPNCNDRLDLKLNRLFRHQLPLGRSACVESQLHLHGIPPSGLKPVLQLQGYLFYPTRYRVAPPLHSNPDHLRGNWYYLEDFLDQLDSQSGSRWLPLAKADWLIPASAHPDHLLDKSQAVHFLQNRISTNPRPVLIAEMMDTADDTNGAWHEQQRCFIVPNHWPFMATPSRKT